MSDNEILSQILVELKEIKLTVRDLNSGIEAQNELVLNRLSIIENIADKAKVILSEIEKNTAS